MPNDTFLFDKITGLCAGVKRPPLNIGHSMEHNIPFKKASEEVYVEGSAESYGRQWHGMVPGTNTAIGELPARCEFSVQGFIVGMSNTMRCRT